ncbi:MAG TPA: DUF87 domain-containing protein [Candidatus Tyrphobacter sp.]|nr:DUF87 domain-containing protein [Candidatus Tyrphobacter sp.]
MNLILSILIALAFCVGFVWLYWWLGKKMKLGFLRRSLGMKILSVRVPQERAKEGEKDFKNEINKSAQLFSALAGLGEPFVFEAAVHHIGEEIHFYVSVPRTSVDFVKRQIGGLWKESQVEESEDYNIFNSAGAGAGIYLRQKINPILPIRTYEEANLDTFATILSGLSQVNEVGEGVAIQALARPASLGVKKAASQGIVSLKKGGGLSEILKTSFELGDIAKALNPPSKEEKETSVKERAVDEESVKALEAKISKPLLSVNFRVLASAATPVEATALVDNIAGAFSQFSAPQRNELAAVRPRNFDKFAYEYSFREFNESEIIVLNTVELASLFHLPTFTTDLPKIKWLKNKEAAAPTGLPAAGIVLGENVFRGERKKIRLTDNDRRRHLYIVGQTGTGKSVLLKNMAVQDIRDGKGMAVIDPHGDLAEGILALVPKERYDDVIVFDPSDLSRPLGLNMLEYDFNRPEEKTFIANEMQNIFNQLFTVETMGPVFEQYMKNALLLLMEDAPNEPATMMEISRLFTDEEFRKKKLARIKNPAVIDFWEKEAAPVTGEASITNMTHYITSKFNNFTANDYIRPIIGQAKSAFNFRKLMDEGKILIVNLSKGRIGDINANLLGMVIVGKLLMAALSRVDIPNEENRRDFYLYIDEFQNFTTDSIAIILSEARKYRLDLVIAHQFIAQLTDKIRDAVFGNVGSMISFRVGVPDTEVLAKQFEPVFTANDLINIDNYNAYVKLLLNGQTSKPFNIRTLAPEKGDEAIRDALKELSRLRYGRWREDVEAEVWQRLRE